MDLWALADLRTPWCLHVAVTLRIAEHIAAGREEIGALAGAASCDATMLGLVLTHLAHAGVFEEPEPGRFRLNEAARQLLEPGARSGLDLDGFGGRMAHAWSTLLTLVRTGKPAYRDVFGRPFWEDLDAHPEIGAAFDALMGPGHGTPDADFPLAGGWEAVRTVTDVGGGTGAMLAEILRARPWIRGTLVDLPRAAAASAETFRAAGVSDRARAVGQSFFDPLPAGDDVYLLRGVINDWPDPEAAAILRRCAEAAQVVGGRVVVLKSVSPDERPAEIQIETVLLGGRQRTLGEFRTLAAGCGLEVAAAGRQKSGASFVECRPEACATDTAR
ncbi:MAG: hydroxyneurosporene methyltransferase [Acidobacteria bacterium]|nr:hydroxyneurosporene methyltransferase [Acidobacteriota bacterium]